MLNFCPFCGNDLVVAPELNIQEAKGDVMKCANCNMGFYTSPPLNFIAASTKGGMKDFFRHLWYIVTGNTHCPHCGCKRVPWRGGQWSCYCCDLLPRRVCPNRNRR